MPVGWILGSLSRNTLESGGELTRARAWSTMKVPVIVASITSGDADWHAIEDAITRSDNDAALRLWARLRDGPAAVEAVLRRAGDRETVLERASASRAAGARARTAATT